MKLTTKVFFDQCFDKPKFQSFIYWFFRQHLNGQYKALKFLEKIKFLGFYSATEAGFSISIEDLNIGQLKSLEFSTVEKEISEIDMNFNSGFLTTMENYQQVLDIWLQLIEDFKFSILQHYKNYDLFNPVYLMSFSGARGNIAQIRQLVAMRGFMADPLGQLIDFPIRNNLREGLTLPEYLISCSGARKGIIDTALRTAASGYLTRRLVDVAHHVVVNKLDCQKKTFLNQPTGISIESLYDKKKRILSLEERLIGRILSEDVMDSDFSSIIGSKNQEISSILARKICLVRKKVFVRSPLTCQSSKSICQLCYGWSLAEGQLVSLGEAIGVLAAQSIGEPGTQLTMRTFHTGGVFTGQLLDQTYASNSGRIEYKTFCFGLLVRNEHGKIAYLTKNSGVFFLKSTSLLEKKNEKLKKILLKFDNLISLNSNHKFTETVEKTGIFFEKNSLLYVRHNEYVCEKQLLIEIPVTKDKKSLENEIEICSPISGEVYFDNLIYSETTRDTQILKTTILNSNKIWILAGHTFKAFNLVKKDKLKNTFIKKFDLVNSQVPFYQSLIQPFFYSTINKLEIINDNDLCKIKIYSFNNNSFSIFSIFFKKIGYLQILYNYKKKIYSFAQIPNSYELKNHSKIWKNFFKIEKNKKFETCYIGLQNSYPLLQYYISEIFSKVERLEFSIAKNTNFIGSLKTFQKKLLSEFPNFYSVKPFFLQENTNILRITRQGYLKFIGLNQKKKESFFFKNQLKYKIKQKNLVKLEYKNFLFQPLLFLNTLQLNSKELTKKNFFKKPIQSSFYSIFFNQLKFLQNLPQSWKLKKKVKKVKKMKFPIIVHWKNISNHKYLFVLSFFHFLKKNDYQLLKKRFFYNIRLGFFSYVRVFFFIENNLEFKKILRKNLSLVRTNFIDKSLKTENSFFQFLLSLKIFFYTNLIKKTKQKEFLTCSILDRVILKQKNFVFLDFFMKGFKDTFSLKKIYDNFSNIKQQNLKSLFFNQQFLTKRLNILTFDLSVENNVWEFFGDGAHLFKQTKISTYSKIYFRKKTPKTENSLYNIWPAISYFLKKKSKRQVSSLINHKFLLEKILPNSTIDSFNIVEKGFLKKNIYPLNYKINVTKIKKKNFDSYTNFYFYILKNFDLIKNFNIRFSQTLPQKPTNNSFFFKAENNLLQNYKIQRLKDIYTLPEIQINKLQNFYDFYIECISKKSSISQNKFNKPENLNLNISNIYYSRFYVSSLFPLKEEKKTCIIKKQKFKTVFFNFENQAFSFNFGIKNFSNFYQLENNKNLKTLNKKTILPNFLICKPLCFILYRMKRTKKRHKFRMLNKSDFFIKNSFFLKNCFFFYSNIQIYLNNIEPIYAHDCSDYKNIILNKTASLKLYFTKVRELDYLYRKIPKKATFQIIQQKSHFHCFETQIFVRFFLSFNQDSEMIDYRPLFISDKNLYTQKTLLLQKPLTFNLLLHKVKETKAFTHKQFLPLSLTITKNITTYAKHIKLGEILESNKILKNYININSGQIIAKTKENFVIREVVKQCINPDTIIYVYPHQIISESQRIYNVFFSQEKTGDIIQGIPKIEEIFEARKKNKHGFLNVSTFRGNISFFESQVFSYLEITQKNAINNIQKIYCGQGVHIADKHIEIIVRQMTSNVLILDPGQTGLLPGEIVSFDWIRKLQAKIEIHYILYEPLFMGISRTCLETSNFLSAASFQETTRVLTRAAIQNQIDFLGGLKQNVILGNLLPMGTGCFKPLNP
uniref:DNA-directed RNA polymerase n=1 Tax=Boodleopsis sp. FL1161 TaxID=2364084 RepID=A0A386AZ43_9CHLO|nr:RNA polymerase b-subunit [Boodleopsis sp. FL1161]